MLPVAAHLLCDLGVVVEKSTEKKAIWEAVPIFPFSFSQQSRNSFQNKRGRWTQKFTGLLCVSLIRASYAFGIASEARTTSRRDSSRSCPGTNGQNLEVSTFAKRACLTLISSPHSNLSQAPSCPCHILHGVFVWPL